MESKELDDMVFGKCEELVGEACATLSHRERIAVLLEISTPIFQIVQRALNKIGTPVLVVNPTKRVRGPNKKKAAQLPQLPTAPDLTQPAPHAAAGPFAA